MTYTIAPRTFERGLTWKRKTEYTSIDGVISRFMNLPLERAVDYAVGISEPGYTKNRQETWEGVDGSMDYLENVSLNKAQKQLPALCEKVASYNKPILISGAAGNTILISEKEWKSMEETLYICSIPGMADSLLANNNEPLESMVNADDLEW